MPCIYGAWLMITQYNDSYSSPPSDVQNLISNKVALADYYILMQTGQYEYTALIKNPATKEVTKYRIYRSNNNYSSYYYIDESVADFEFNITNEYYVYSNVGYGKHLDLPIYEGVTSHCLMIICCFLMFGVVFKGVLLPCLKRRR